MLLLMVLVAGCKSALDVYESKAPAAVVVSTNSNGTLSLASRGLSSEIVLVTAAVQRVDLPLLNSPSIAGDKATCMLSVPAHSIPAHPNFRRVALHYDNHGWLQGLDAGTQLVLRFQKNGEFGGVEFPANFIQQNGPANRSQPVSLQTNQPSAAAGSGR
jgi:hypothetical protein